jgi:hypothetical protein
MRFNSAFKGLNIRHIRRTLFRLRAVELNGNYELYFTSQRFVRQAVCVKTDKVLYEFRKIKRYCLSILTLRRRIKSRLLFAGIIRSSPFSPR